MWSAGKESACNVGDLGSITGSGRSPGEEKGCHFSLEEIKKSQSIMNNAINEIKNTLEGTNSRIRDAEDRSSEEEDRMVEINEAERKKEKKN